MQEVLRKLEQVQEIDLQINKILEKKAEFPKRLEGFEADIKAHTTKYDEKKKFVDELERNKRQQTGALELNEERAKRSQEKLEQIKTNQEYTALQKEIESLKKNSTIIQENSNKAGGEVDKHRKELADIENVLNAAKTKRDTESAQITEEIKVIDVDLVKLTDQRKKAIEGIDKRYMSTYDRVRQTKGGMGVASATAGTCKGCNMRIPPQIYNELQRGTELFTCPSCRRILIYKDGPRAGAGQPGAIANG